MLGAMEDEESYHHPEHILSLSVLSWYTTKIRIAIEPRDLAPKTENWKVAFVHLTIYTIFPLPPNAGSTQLHTLNFPLLISQMSLPLEHYYITSPIAQ